jgi:hypothetical protein
MLWCAAKKRRLRRRAPHFTFLLGLCLQPEIGLSVFAFLFRSASGIYTVILHCSIGDHLTKYRQRGRPLSMGGLFQHVRLNGGHRYARMKYACVLTPPMLDWISLF